jgi:N-acetylneuraminate synthase
MQIKGRTIGSQNPIYIIAEVGINHNGSIDDALKMVRIAKEAGCDAVKFQKREPEICVPEEQKHQLRDTPWGEMTYIDYRKKVEFGRQEYSLISDLAAELKIDWFASPWDTPSVSFLAELKVPVLKVASACLTDDSLLKAIRETGIPVILSTGMSTIEQIDHAVSMLDRSNLILMATTSSYPMQVEEANLRTIMTLSERYQVPVGYSGHETGLQISMAAAALGAVAIERHITLDRTNWGTDQSASLEPSGLERLVRDVRIIEKALGDGVKKVWPSELVPMKKLRRF